MDENIYSQIEKVSVLEKRVEKASAFELKNAALALAKAQKNLSIMLAQKLSEVTDTVKQLELKTA